MRRGLGALVVAILALAFGGGGAVAQEADFALPDGHFFTQAAPDRTDGSGFAVEDGHGARLWTAYEAAGGVEALGYPISQRFDLDDGIAQGFQWGVLRWNADSGSADLVEYVAAPKDAKVPEQPPVAGAELETPPWSGWWWPASESIGPTLFAPNSPLDKYDQLVAAETGHNPGTRAWERQTVYFPGSQWAGHCNGFAAAALLEPEPTGPRDINGITFSVADQKGLLADYHFADAAAWTFGANDETLNPADFHRMLLNWIGVANKGFVLTYDMGSGEVWSYPVYRFESAWSMDPTDDSAWHVKTTVWMADMDVPPNFVGTRPYPSEAGKTFEYTLFGDPRDPSDGTWSGASQSGRFAHPGRIWYPEPSVRNGDRELVAPGLDRGVIASIVTGN